MIIYFNNQFLMVTIIAQNVVTGNALVEDSDGKQYIVPLSAIDKAKELNQTTNSRGPLNLFK